MTIVDMHLRKIAWITFTKCQVHACKITRMRVLAYIAAFGLVIFVGYHLVTDGYVSFLRHTHSVIGAQIMTLGTLALTCAATFWAVKRLP